MQTMQMMQVCLAQWSSRFSYPFLQGRWPERPQSDFGATGRISRCTSQWRSVGCTRSPPVSSLEWCIRAAGHCSKCEWVSRDTTHQSMLEHPPHRRSSSPSAACESPRHALAFDVAIRFGSIELHAVARCLASSAQQIHVSYSRFDSVRRAESPGLDSSCSLLWAASSSTSTSSSTSFRCSCQQNETNIIKPMCLALPKPGFHATHQGRDQLDQDGFPFDGQVVTVDFPFRNVLLLAEPHERRRQRVLVFVLILVLLCICRVPFATVTRLDSTRARARARAPPPSCTRLWCQPEESQSPWLSNAFNIHRVGLP